MMARAGYTLVEVLLATVLFAGGMVVVLQAYTHAANATGEVAEVLRTSILLESTAEEVSRFAAPVAYAGRCDAPYEEYHRRVEIRDIQAPPRLAEVTIIVGKDGSGQRSTLVTRSYAATP